VTNNGKKTKYNTFSKDCAFDNYFGEPKNEKQKEQGYYL